MTDWWGIFDYLDYDLGLACLGALFWRAELFMLKNAEFRLNNDDGCLDCNYRCAHPGAGVLGVRCRHWWDRIPPVSTRTQVWGEWLELMLNTMDFILKTRYKPHDNWSSGTTGSRLHANNDGSTTQNGVKHAGVCWRMSPRWSGGGWALTVLASQSDSTQVQHSWPHYRPTAADETAWKSHYRPTARDETTHHL